QDPPLRSIAPDRARAQEPGGGAAVRVDGTGARTEPVGSAQRRLGSLRGRLRIVGARQAAPPSVLAPRAGLPTRARQAAGAGPGRRAPQAARGGGAGMDSPTSRSARVRSGPGRPPRSPGGEPRVRLAAFARLTAS